MNLKFTAPNIREFETSMIKFADMVSFQVFRDSEKKMQEKFFDAEKKLFQSQGSSGNYGNWPPLSEAYKKWKDTHYPGVGIMVLRGNLLKSLTSVKPETIFNTSKRGNSIILKMGTDVKSKEGFDYPLYWQTTDKTRRTIDPTLKNMKSIIEVLQKEVYDAAKKTRAIDKVNAKIGNFEFDSGVPLG